MPEPWVAGISLLFVACSFSLDLPEKKGDERRRESESVREREKARQNETRKKEDARTLVWAPFSFSC